MPLRASPRPRPMSLAENDPSPEKIVCANWPTKLALAPSAAGNLPLNRPVAASIEGRLPPLTSTPRPSTEGVNVAVLCRLLAGATGMIGLVLRGDSMLDGPDWNELMSNAVTE